MNSQTVASNLKFDILRIVNSEYQEVIRIAPDGKLFWRGREVETDADFRAAMLELADRLVEKTRPYATDRDGGTNGR